MKRNHYHSAYISKWYNCINNHFTDYIHFITADIVLRKSFHWPRSDTHNRPKIVTTVSPSFVKTMVSSFSLQSKPKGKHCLGKLGNSLTYPCIQSKCVCTTYKNISDVRLVMYMFMRAAQFPGLFNSLFPWLIRICFLWMWFLLFWLFSKL